MPSNARSTDIFSERTRKLLANPEALCNMIRRIAMEAGDITLKYFDGLEDMGLERKDDNSPVTLADQEAEDYIQKALAELMPEIVMIGEETAAQNGPECVEGHEYFWLVDPLDGTREFIIGSEEFTVNIALIQNAKPILGVVYAPAKGELFAGCGPGTAIRWSEESGRDKPISVRPPPKQGLTIVSSKAHGSNTRLEQFLQGFKIEKIIKRGSSLKICAIAAGKADMYPRFGPTCEWDTAAGDAVLQAAGGTIMCMQGKPLIYGGANPQWLNPEFIAASFEWYEEA